MTQEEKQLLLKDICERLQYGLICSIYREDDEGFGWRDDECKGYFQNNGSYEFYFDDIITIDNIERLKPYLRPMSSMTEEEKNEYTAFIFIIKKDVPNCIYHTCEMVEVEEINNIIDWLNEHHFDYLGLIEKGLALEAKDWMYKTKQDESNNQIKSVQD